MNPPKMNGYSTCDGLDASSILSVCRVCKIRTTLLLAVSPNDLDDISRPNVALQYVLWFSASPPVRYDTPTRCDYFHETGQLSIIIHNGFLEDDFFKN